MTESKQLGMLTPSSNTVLEPALALMLEGNRSVSVHYSRFRVVAINLGDQAMQQFADDNLLQAADLLGDAKLDVICWNGTSSGWLGFDADVRLCESIESRTGIKACTSVLAMNRALELTGAKRIAFVTPYLDEVQQAIIRNYEANGYEVVAERHLQDPGNHSFAQYSEAQITDLCREVAEAQPQAICIFCTNFRGAAVAPVIEKELGIPVYDTVSTALWQSLVVAGGDTRSITGWGSLFDLKDA